MKKLAIVVLAAWSGILGARASRPPAALANGWTDPVEVRHELMRCVSYRARLAGDFLVIQTMHEPGWHTYAMDNKLRAKEKLAGKESLGIDGPTEIKVTGGLQVVGPWYQSPPKDYSKPDILWYTFGFEGQSEFAVKVRRAGAGPARIAIEGQACTPKICKQIDVEISLPAPAHKTGAVGPAIDLKSLVRVRQ